MSQKSKLLITGSNGLLGQSLSKKFRDKYYTLGCDLTRDSFNTAFPLDEYHQLDLTERDNTKKFLSEQKPELIINTVAFNDVDKAEAERDNCWETNVRVVELIIENVSDYNPLIIQISTDYVFDGKAGMYSERDEINPLSYYGHTKLESEKILMSSGFDYIIARSMILYGNGQNVRNNFATWIIKEIKNGNEVKVVNDQKGNPTFVDDLSEALFRLIQRAEYGLFHVAGDKVCSRYDFALRIAKIFNLNESLIREITTSELRQKAKRPKNSSFKLDKLGNTLDWLPGKLDNSLDRFKQLLDK